MSEETLFSVKTRFVEKFPVDKLPVEYPTILPDQRFVESIRQFGILHPLVCKEQEGTDDLKLIAGRRRLDAARKLQFKTVPVRIFPADWTDEEAEAAAAVTENRMRRPNPVSDLHQFEVLLGLGKTEDEARGRLALTVQEMKRLLLIRNNLIHPLRRALEDHIIGVGTAEACAKKSVRIQKRLLNLLEEEGRLSKKDVERACKVEKKKAVSALPVDLFGMVDGNWRNRVKELLGEAKEVAGNDGNARLLKLLTDALEEVK